MLTRYGGFKRCNEIRCLGYWFVLVHWSLRHARERSVPRTKEQAAAETRRATAETLVPAEPARAAADKAEQAMARRPARAAVRDPAVRAAARDPAVRAAVRAAAPAARAVRAARAEWILMKERGRRVSIKSMLCARRKDCRRMLGGKKPSLAWINKRRGMK